MSDGLAIDAGFPGGNILLERISGDQVYLSPDLRDTERWWFYWYFRVTGCGGRSLTFNFEGDNPIGVRGPAASGDGGRSWRWLGEGALVQEGSFRYAFPRTSEDTRFCFAIPYVESNLREFLGQHSTNPALEVRKLCRTRKGRVAERLHLGRIDGSAPIRVLVTVRHHACEMMASYVLEGLMEAILSHTPDGDWFRDSVELMAIPFVDKDGVEDGDQGKLRRPRDHNRDYEGKSLYPSVAAIRRIVPAWSDGRLRVALDLHCPWIRGKRNESIYIVGSPDEKMWKEQCEFGSVLETVQRGPLTYRVEDNLPYGVDWNVASDSSTGKSSSSWASELAGIRLVAGIEFPYATARGTEVNPESSRAFGRDLARALRTYLPSLGGA
jgi:hypothetical protein